MMGSPEAKPKIATLDDLIVEAIASNAFNRYTTTRYLEGGIVHDVDSWEAEMHAHTAETLGIPFGSELIVAGLAECRRRAQEELDRGGN